jgi:oxalate decarboxylase/phosphoglucose isomerase-like protein (cupin superfamily)
MPRTRTRSIISGLWLLGVVLLAGSTAAGVERQGTPMQPAGTPLVDAEHKRLQPEAALTGGSVKVFGDPAMPGMYVYRNRFGPGQASRPHFHDQDRYVTVIKGTWWTGEGDVFQADKMVPIKAGGFMFHPAGFHHYDGAKDEEVIVQIMGMGPVKTTDTEKK